MSRFAVILPAAGKSSRFGDARKKPFLPLLGRPVWQHAAVRFARRSDVIQLILVLADEDRAHFVQTAPAVTVAPGGVERFESVANALALVAPEAEFVAIHDAARPCLTDELIDRVFGKAIETGAAMLAVPVADTLKRADEAGRVQETVSRRGLWLAQTPQVFRRDWLEAAFAARARLGDITDDARLVEALGHAVHLVPGSPANLKITTADDLALAEAILRAG
jgi:2-C-methyl-D-erythritol 4-phosphate cytidylyltransferase